MARPRKFTKKDLEEKWEEYKYSCDHQFIEKTEFDIRKGEYVTGMKRVYNTYTIVGFCLFIGISKQSFYDYYEKNERYADFVSRMKLECEQDVRAKFEREQIPTKLSGLWMSKYDYTTKKEVEQTGAGNQIQVVIKSDTGEDEEDLAL